jgi:hypothetical protein
MSAPNLRLLQTRREEAIAFFEVNQAARSAAERVMALIFSVGAITASVGIAAKTDRVVLPLPAVLLLLLSYMFQQYGDLTVVGTTRRYLEDLVNHELRGEGLVYESAVAGIRKATPLVRSVRVPQAAIGWAVWIVVDGVRLLMTIGFVLATTVAFASAAPSYRDMLRSGSEATDRLREHGLGRNHLVWIPPDLYWAALQTRSAGELEGDTFIRSLERSLTENEMERGPRKGRTA